MKILITGGGGFVGRHFARAMYHRGDEVCIIDNLSEGKWPFKWQPFDPELISGIQFIKRDVREFFHHHRSDEFDMVIHCAAIVGGRRVLDGDPLAVATNLSIDSEMFNWIVRGTPIPKLVYFSSSAVYPVEFQTRQHHIALNESLTNFESSRIGLPEMTYGFVKLAGEYMAKIAAEKYGLNVKIYRPFGGYGGDQSLDYPFPSIVKRVLDGEDPVTVWGSGKQLRDFIHIDDIVQGVLQTFDHLPAGSVLNLGTGCGTSFALLAHDIAAVLGREIRVVNDDSKPEGVFARVADAHKMFQHYQPRVTLWQGIEQAIKHLTAASELV